MALEQPVSVPVSPESTTPLSSLPPPKMVLSGVQAARAKTRSVGKVLMISPGRGPLSQVTAAGRSTQCVLAARAGIEATPTRLASP